MGLVALQLWILSDQGLDPVLHCKRLRHNECDGYACQMEVRTACHRHTFSRGCCQCRKRSGKSVKGQKVKAAGPETACGFENGHSVCLFSLAGALRRQLIFSEDKQKRRAERANGKNVVGVEGETLMEEVLHTFAFSLILSDAASLAPVSGYDYKADVLDLTSLQFSIDALSSFTEKTVGFGQETDIPAIKHLAEEGKGGAGWNQRPSQKVDMGEGQFTRLEKSPPCDLTPWNSILHTPLEISSEQTYLGFTASTHIQANFLTLPAGTTPALNSKDKHQLYYPSMFQAPSKCFTCENCSSSPDPVRSPGCEKSCSRNQELIRPVLFFCSLTGDI
ncbi:hypothetical protein JEQ12_000680 [Ovis aries]|uniref:Uncharacterized protein n=1 Tax=Ovis aries TaxID=9940 RepID=A0A836D7Z0_SHEEP|nr:hypothetical protein JEQ12_000680 [Ovis aries]